MALDDAGGAAPGAWAEVVQLVRSDVHRTAGRSDLATSLRVLATTPILRLQAVHRAGHWATKGRGRAGLRLMAAALYRRQSVRLGIELPFGATIGPGLKILHHGGGVVINPGSVLGRNCTISNSVTLSGSGGPRGGHPTLGDDVFLSPGVVVHGPVRVGDRTTVAANAVVTSDAGPDQVVGGIPARVIPGADPVVPSHPVAPASAR